jgi:hypothetical protein
LFQGNEPCHKEVCLMPTKPYLGKTLSEIAMFRPYPSGRGGAVSSNSPYATSAGLEMMKNGGNAIDCGSCNFFGAGSC